MKELKKLRINVDRLDDRLIELLNARAKLSQEIGLLKRGTHNQVYAPDREAQVLRRLGRLVEKGPLTDSAVRAIYREIMSSSLSLEKPLSIAYLGPELTFTHQASVKKFGSSVTHTPCQDISDVFLEVEHGRSDYGVVPVENSTEGAVTHTLDSFLDSDIRICSEIILKISLNLLSREKSLKKIRHVYSKPEVFGQCRRWLESHLGGVELRKSGSTSQGALLASVEKRSACIASRLVADHYGLKVLAPSIEDQANNATRFLVISREDAKPTGEDKTSIVFSIKDSVGALHRTLEPFRRFRINLTKIESRPSKRRRWEYYFFADFEGHREEPRVTKALKRLDAACHFVKILGSYPRNSQIVS